MQEGRKGEFICQKSALVPSRIINQESQEVFYYLPTVYRFMAVYHGRTTIDLGFIQLTPPPTQTDKENENCSAIGNWTKHNAGGNNANKLYFTSLQIDAHANVIFQDLSRLIARRFVAVIKVSSASRISHCRRPSLCS
jgi:hypothetical protein